MQTLFSPTRKSEKVSLKTTLKRRKFFVSQQNDPLCVLCTLKFAPRAVLVCNKQYQATALEGSSYSEGACLLNFWLCPGLQDPFAHILWLWGFSVHRRDFFFLWIFAMIFAFDFFTVISQTYLSCFAPGSPCLCKGWGTDDTEVLVENHHIYLSTKTMPVWNLSFITFRLILIQDLWCICIGDAINNFSRF